MTFKQLMKPVFFLIVLWILHSSCSFRDLSSYKNNKENLVQYVNTLIGSESSKDLSAGNTYPAVALPWGMNAWTPQTGNATDPWIYTYKSKSIQGFRCTHSPNPWMGDYGAFVLMPEVGELIIDGDSRASAFSHVNEIAKPYYYQVELERYNVNVEMAPSTRGAIMKFTFPESEASHILLDALPGESFLRVLPQQRRIIGYTRNHTGKIQSNFACYFILEFDKNFMGFTVWDDEQISGSLRELYTKGHGGVAVRFQTARKETIQVKITTSFISIKQAIINFNQELSRSNFEQLRIKANQNWNDELNKIVVEGGSVDQKFNFYSSYYRALLFPRIFYEFTEDNKMVHYSPYDKQLHNGYMFADIGFWSAFRSLFPFFTIMYPDKSAAMMQWLVNVYNEGGWLPSWPSPGYRKGMSGSHTASLFTDAYMKGIREFDAELAYEAMKKDAIVTPPRYAPGRDGLKEYNDLGYIPFPDYKGATSKTLDYAYDDYCILQLARSLNQNDDINLYQNKAFNYKNVFDKNTRFMRGRQLNGEWYKPFDPLEWGGAYTAGNAWHSNWSVFHDVHGLIDIMGGTDHFIEKLDSIFIIPAEFKVGSYKKVNHKMTEMVLSDMGQYGHGNQPVQHLAYLYSYAGAPWKTQKRVREIMDKLYRPTPDGLCSDEDNGQMSAWYLFSAMGFYPVTPGHPSYVLGTPIFRRITLNLPNGKKFVISAPDNNVQNIYADEIELNGNKISRNWISHGEILEGGKLLFKLNDKPNKKRGTERNDAPYSLTNELLDKE